MIVRNFLMVGMFFSINSFSHAMEKKIVLPSAQEVKTRLSLHRDFVQCSMLDYHLGSKELSGLEIVTILDKSLDKYDEYCGNDIFVAKMMRIMKTSILQSILQIPLEECEKMIKESAQKNTK